MVNLTKWGQAESLCFLFYVEVESVRGDLKLLASVNLILVAELCSSTTRIRPYHYGHRTEVVLSSDKHWHAVLEHC